MHCPFCQLPPERILHSNAHALVIRDGYPITPGHTLIIPRRHVGSFFETTTEERHALLELLDWAKAELEGTQATIAEGTQTPTLSEQTETPPFTEHTQSPPFFKGGQGGFPIPTAYNIGINDGPAAGQTVPHLHIHLIPRYQGDAKDPRGGVRWIMPEKADYWSGRE